MVATARRPVSRHIDSAARREPRETAAIKLATTSAANQSPSQPKRGFFAALLRSLSVFAV